MLVRVLVDAHDCACDLAPQPPVPPLPPKPPPPTPPSPSPPPPCKAKVDVVIVLDGSASIVDSDWQRALIFTNKIVDSFNISTDQAEVGVVQFSGGLFGQNTEIIITLSSDVAAIKAAVSSAQQMKEDTNTYAGFEAAKKMLDGQGRSDAKGKVVILITDGDQNDGRPAVVAARELKAENATIFGVGVGSSVNTQKLEQWVTSPASQHYFSVSDFAHLRTILERIIAGACPHPLVARP